MRAYGGRLQIQIAFVGLKDSGKSEIPLVVVVRRIRLQFPFPAARPTASRRTTVRGDSPQLPPLYAHSQNRVTVKTMGRVHHGRGARHQFEYMDTTVQTPRHPHVSTVQVKPKATRAKRAVVPWTARPVWRWGFFVLRYVSFFCARFRFRVWQISAIVFFFFLRIRRTFLFFLVFPSDVNYKDVFIVCALPRKQKSPVINFFIEFDFEKLAIQGKISGQLLIIFFEDRIFCVLIFDTNFRFFTAKIFCFKDICSLKIHFFLWNSIRWQKLFFAIYFSSVRWYT